MKIDVVGDRAEIESGVASSSRSSTSGIKLRFSCVTISPVSSYVAARDLPRRVGCGAGSRNDRFRYRGSASMLEARIEI